MNTPTSISLFERADSWSSARSEFYSLVLPRLKRLGKEIGKQAESGLKEAQQVIYYYQMLRRSFDPMALVLLEEAIEVYEKHTHDN